MKAISDYISDERLALIIWGYTLIKENEVRANDPARETILTNARSLRKTLQGLIKRGYLTEEGMRNIIKSFFRNLSINDDIKKVGSILWELYFKGNKGGGPYRDRALDLLLAAIFEAWPGEPDYKVIADFLCEKLDMQEITDRAIERRHERISPKEIDTTRRLYNMLGVFFAEMTAEDRKSEIADIFTDALLG
jgi:hypothetical protein